MKLSIERRALLLGAAAWAALSTHRALAGGAVLTVRGEIALEELEAQPHTAFVTRTPWHSQAVSFEGIGLDALLDLVGATGTRLQLTALNDYAVEAEIAELRGRGGLIAYRENGLEMPISNKGPLFVVFPFDADATLQHQSIYARCVWQLSTIEIK